MPEQMKEEFINHLGHSRLNFLIGRSCSTYSLELQAARVESFRDKQQNEELVIETVTAAQMGHQLHLSNQDSALLIYNNHIKERNITVPQLLINNNRIKASNITVPPLDQDDFIRYFRSMNLVQRSVCRPYDNMACIQQICGLRRPPFPRWAFH